uniref:Uncharacterized protein n=1 Tax=Rhizophora mucronata TaxID=61149 RepID=A0A2P2R1U9_RHIMU
MQRQGLDMDIDRAGILIYFNNYWVPSCFLAYYSLSLFCLPIKEQFS